MENNKAIILYDGFCHLCDGTVRFLIKRDKKSLFQFIPLQSEKGKQILIDKNIPEVDSVVFAYGNEVYTQSDALIEMIKLLPSPWNWIRIVKYIPKKCRDYLYDIIAKYRYRWFGRYNSCEIKY